MYSSEPTSLSITVPPAPDGQTKLELHWTDNAVNEVGFSIERKTVGTDFAEIAQTGPDAMPYLDTGLTPGTSYFYRVRAIFSGGYSQYTNIAGRTTLPLIPVPPSGLTVTVPPLPAGQTRLDLTWTDNSDIETGFKIERRKGAESFAQVAQVGANVTSFANTGLEPATAYIFRVRAYNGNGNSAYSNTAQKTTLPLPPTAPTGLTATVPAFPDGQTKLVLNWTDTSSVETGFKIERRKGADPFAQVAEVGANITSYTNTGLAPGTVYVFRVRAFNGSGNSAYSNVTQKATLPLPPAAPSALAVTVPPLLDGQTKLRLTWTDHGTNESGFKVERRMGADPFAEVKQLGANVVAFWDVGLQPGTGYIYRVRAFNASGHSGFSNTAGGVTLPLKPNAPTSLTVTRPDGPDGQSKLQLRWVDNATNESGFKIERRTGVDPFTEIKQVSANVVSFWDVGLQPGTSYAYRVRAFNASGNSAYSNSASRSTLQVAGCSLEAPAELDFGTVRWGRSKTRTATIRNTHATESLQVTVGSPSGGFRVVGGEGTFELAPGETRAVKVRFKADARGTRRGMLPLTSSDPSSHTFNIRLKAKVP